jgi:putative CocE/NonD family hydrolase
MSYGMVRARHRNGLDREELLSPGEIVTFSVKLAPTACCFRRGHRIRLEITSSDFPNHDRNHNTGGNDLQNVDLAIAQQSVFHGGEFSSRLLLPLVPG